MILLSTFHLPLSTIHKHTKSANQKWPLLNFSLNLLIRSQISLPPTFLITFSSPLLTPAPFSSPEIVEVSSWLWHFLPLITRLIYCMTVLKGCNKLSLILFTICFKKERLKDTNTSYQMLFTSHMNRRTKGSHFIVSPDV